MRRLDWILSYCLIGLGVLQCIATYRFFKTPEEPALWFFAGGILLGLVGGLNALRIKYAGSVPMLGWFSIASNLIISSFWITLAWLLAYKFQRYPAAYVALAIILTATLCSIQNLVRIPK